MAAYAQGPKFQLTAALAVKRDDGCSFGGFRLRLYPPYIDKQSPGEGVGRMEPQAKSTERNHRNRYLSPRCRVNRHNRNDVTDAISPTTIQNP